VTSGSADRASDARLASLPVVGAVLIGTTQILALAPGISRSAWTMAAGLLRGLSARTRPAFAFLLATPVILAAGALKLPDLSVPPRRRARGRCCRSVLSGVGAYLRALPDPLPRPSLAASLRRVLPDRRLRQHAALSRSASLAPCPLRRSSERSPGERPGERLAVGWTASRNDTAPRRQPPTPTRLPSSAPTQPGPGCRAVPAATDDRRPARCADRPSTASGRSACCCAPPRPCRRGVRGADLVTSKVDSSYVQGTTRARWSQQRYARGGPTRPRRVRRRRRHVRLACCLPRAAGLDALICGGGPCRGGRGAADPRLRAAFGAAPGPFLTCRPAA